jgi:hypothetical protein
MSNESAVQPGNTVQAAFNDEASLLNDAELEAVSGGTPTVSRVKTSDKHQQAVLAFIKG